MFLSEKKIKDLGDDQLHLTNLYLNTDLREKHKIKLDNYASLFQNLYLAEGSTILLMMNVLFNYYLIKKIIFMCIYR